MYLWRRTADQQWIKTRKDLLQTHAGGRLVIVHRAGRKRLQLEVVCTQEKPAQRLVAKFGGQIKKLPRNWLKQFARGDPKPIKIGKRLLVVRATEKLRNCSVRCRQRNRVRRAAPERLKRPCSASAGMKAVSIIIPACLAFGTGEHATTAMSLRLLEELTRNWKRGWSLLDLGTGTGILAVAAQRFGGGRILGVDNDPNAISTAESNARLNKIRGINFQLADVRKFKAKRENDIVTANLYSELLMEILPKLKPSGWLILSGILRKEETQLLLVLTRNSIETVTVRRRGKWISILARHTGNRGQARLHAPKFCGAYGPPLQ